MSGMCLRPAARPVHYSRPRKRQRAAFTVASSTHESTLVEEGLFFGGGAAAQDPIAVRKAPEPPDDISMVISVFLLLRIAGFAEQLDAAKLVGEMLRMHEGH